MLLEGVELAPRRQAPTRDNYANVGCSFAAAIKGGESFMLNWDDLRVFLAIARTRRLSAAAKSLGLDSTTVSRRLARLAISLDATLFEQYSGVHQLTERGIELLRYAETIEAAALSAQEISDSGPWLGGQLRISVPEGFGWLIAQHLHSFHEQYPHVTLDLVTSASGSGHLSPAKREAEIDLISMRPSRGPVTVRKLVSPTVQMFASKSYLAKHAPIRTLEDVVNHTLIGHVDHLLSSHELNYLAQLGLVAEPVLHSTSILVQYNLVASGAGIAMLPSFIGSQNPDLVVLLPDVVRQVRDLWMVVHQDMRKIPRVRAFVGWLLEFVDANRSLLVCEETARSSG
jgi:DNA-binding transcriptional LysR family regulator